MITVKNNKLINYGNRGMTLEQDINITNDYYMDKKIALIYKKPIPIKVIRINQTKTRIVDAFYEKKSTLDYSGIYKEKYIEFDAKETNSKTSFPISNMILDYIDNTDRKSIPFSFFKDNCYEIKLKYSPRLDYLKIIDIL